MKTLSIVGALLLAVAGAGAAQGFGTETDALIAGIPASELSAAERDGLLLMREEEKLARDVYTTLGELWSIRAFANIAASEQTHMDSVKQLLDRYSVTDPVRVDSTGSFTSPEMKRLYDDLVARGRESAVEALEVGALIEDLDIADLKRLIGETDNDDIKIVYQNLLKGSRNHLRTFSMQIARYGDAYEPRYITAADYRKIVGSRNEAGAISDPDYKL